MAIRNLNELNKKNVDSKAIGLRIWRARDKRGVSAAGLAKEMNVSFQTLYKWESGLCMPRLPKLERLARILHVSIHWLLMGENPGNLESYPDEGLTLGQRIQIIRHDCGISMREMQDVFDVNYQTLYKWEGDICVPSLENLATLSRMFRVPVDVLLGQYTRRSVAA